MSVRDAGTKGSAFRTKPDGKGRDASQRTARFLFDDSSRRPASDPLRNRGKRKPGADSTGTRTIWEVRSMPNRPSPPRKIAAQTTNNAALFPSARRHFEYCVFSFQENAAVRTHHFGPCAFVAVSCKPDLPPSPSIDRTAPTVSVASLFFPAAKRKRRSHNSKPIAQIISEIFDL